MFIIFESDVLVAPKNSELSHWEWVKSEKLIEDKNILNKLVRGFVDSEGMYFYQNDNFSINQKAEKIFFEKFPRIVEKLKVDLDKHVFGGMIEQEWKGKWPTEKDYGVVGDLLKIYGEK